MEPISMTISLAVGVILGALILYLIMRSGSNHRVEKLQLEFENEMTSLKSENAGELATLKTRIEEQREGNKEKLQLLIEAQDALKDSFSSLSIKALNENSETFTKQAETILKGYQEKAVDDLKQRQEKIGEVVRPVKEQLDKFNDYVREVEKERGSSYSTLKAQVETLAKSQDELNNATNNLVRVLGNSKTRGQWGEIQLKRIVELAGMKEYCDFNKQVSVSTEEGRQRPDLIVRLPSERIIVVDAKAPMDAYLEAHEATDESIRTKLFRRHAVSIRAHMAALKSKDYQRSLEQSPDFIFMFLPNDAVYSAALEYDPALIEDGAKDNVIIATPVTLIALLKAAAYGWRQEKIADEVRRFSELGKEFYERLATVTRHISKLGKSIDNSVQDYNKMVGSIDRRLMPTARKFHESNIVGDTSKSLKEIELVERVTREQVEMKSLDSPEQLEQDLDALSEDFEEQFGKLKIASAAGGDE